MIALAERLGGSAAAKTREFQTETFRAHKSAPRKRSSGAVPDASWTVAALTSAVKREHQRIEHGAARVTPYYWRLGSALELIRQKRHFRRGEWETWLKGQKIAKIRAFRARRIAKHFSFAEAQELSLEDALERVARRQPRSVGKLTRKLARRLRNLAKTIVRTADESAQLGERRGDLLAHAHEIVEALDYFRGACAKSR